MGDTGAKTKELQDFFSTHKSKIKIDSSYGLEIPCEYLLECNTRVVDWLLQKVEKEREFCKKIGLHDPRTKILKTEGAIYIR